jgi:hypothetical protein
LSEPPIREKKTGNNSLRIPPLSTRICPLRGGFAPRITLFSGNGT